MAAPASPTPPAPMAIVVPPAGPNLVTVNFNGLPVICAGDRFTFSAGGANGTYTCSPNVQSGQFENCYLAGININSTNRGGVTVERVVDIDRSSFAFPTLLSLPGTPQFTNAISNDVVDQVAETRGIYCKFPITQITNSTFTQANDPYTDFAFAQRTKQIGVKGGHIGAFTDNSCSLLHVGLFFTNVSYPNFLTGNVFTACGRGIDVHGRAVPLRPDSSNAVPPLSPRQINCNTFDRANASCSGSAYGVYLESDAQVTFDPISGTSPASTLQNKFLDYNTGPRGGFFAIYNSSFVAPAAVQYTTYPNYLSGSISMLNGHSNLDVLSYRVTLLPGNRSYAHGQACGIGNPGLERTAPSKSALEPKSGLRLHQPSLPVSTKCQHGGN